MALIWSQWAVLALLAIALFTNLRSGRIANWLVLAIVAVYIARVAETGAWDSVLWQALFALGVFVLGLTMYFANLCSAGGAKLMGAVGLAWDIRPVPARLYREAAQGPVAAPGPARSKVVAPLP